MFTSSILASMPHAYPLLIWYHLCDQLFKSTRHACSLHINCVAREGRKVISTCARVCFHGLLNKPTRNLQLGPNAHAYNYTDIDNLKRDVYIYI
jgi:hypothetical protein